MMTMATSMAMAGARSSLFKQASRGSSLETIDGVVTPYLPIKASLVEYFHTLELMDLIPRLRPKSATKEILEIEGPPNKQPPSGYLRGFNDWQVRTVAAQTRSLPVLRDQILKASRSFYLLVIVLGTAICCRGVW